MKIIQNIEIIMEIVDGTNSIIYQHYFFANYGNNYIRYNRFNINICRSMYLKVGNYSFLNGIGNLGNGSRMKRVIDIHRQYNNYSFHQLIILMSYELNREDY